MSIVKFIEIKIYNFNKKRKIKLLILCLLLLILVPMFSGCSNKPDLKQWSKATAAYLLSQKYPEIVNSKRRISIFTTTGFTVFVSHKIIDNFNIGVMKFNKIISCNSNRTTHVVTCWYTVNFIPNKTYNKVKEELLKDHCVIHKTGQAQAIFQQTTNKKWYICVLQWQWKKHIVSWHYPY